MDHRNLWTRTLVSADMDITNCETADMDADTDMKNFRIADTDADMTSSKNSGHGHEANKPRTRVSTDLWGSLNSDDINLSIE